MLRLLPKRLTPAEADFIKHLLFVCVAHAVALIVLVAYTKKSVLLLNIRSFQKAEHVVIQWRSAARGFHGPSSTVTNITRRAPQRVKHKKAPAKLPVQAPNHPRPTFTKIDLGAKKKRRDQAPPHVPTAPAPEKVPEPLQIAVDEAVQEPLVMSVHEYAQQQQIAEIVEAVKRWWQPPLGVRPDALCIIMVTIAPTGACKEARVQRSSGVPVYDIAAKSAVLKSNFPKHIWGKQCVFQF